MLKRSFNNCVLVSIVYTKENNSILFSICLKLKVEDKKAAG